MEIRTTFGAEPAAICCSTVSCLCVVDAVCMTSERLSPKFDTWLKISSAFTNFMQLSYQPFRATVNKPPAPFGHTFLTRSKYGEDFNPA